MSKAPSLPLFCGDYLKDTPDLSLEEHGAYLMLLMYTWSNGCRPLPDDDDRIARRLRITKERWVKRLRPILAPLFDLSDGNWRSPRLEKEWAYVQEKIRAKRANGSLGGRPPKNDPGNGPENSPVSEAKVQCNTPESHDDKPLKYNDTPKANGFVPHNLQETSPSPSIESTFHEEDSSLSSHVQKPAPAQRAGGFSGAYVGKNFSLGEKTFRDYQRTFHAIPDMTAALRMLDEDLDGRPPGQVLGAVRARLHGMHQKLSAVRDEKIAKPRRSGNMVIGGSRGR